MNNDRDGLEPTLTRAAPGQGDDQVDRATVLIEDDATRVVSALFCPICGGHFPGGLANCTTDGTQLVPVGTGDDLSGTVLRDKYVLVELIGKGGFAQVYRATHRMAKAEVAVKVIRDELRENQKARRQFLKEARASMRMQSRYAVAVHDVDEDEAGRMYIVMELLRGLNLEDHMKLVAPETRRLKWDETARIVIEICDALEEAHDKGIVHRDLKPGNVMMVEGRLGKLQSKVVDFGIASLVQSGDSDLTSMDNIPKVIGTPSFMSPEQARGLSVTHKSDLYSLGAMMYRMVCGCRPFDAKTDQGMLIAHVMEQPPSIRSKFPELDVPAAFDDLVMRMMAKKPEDRPADAAEVAEALRAIVPADGGKRKGGEGDGGRRNRRYLPLIAVAVVILVAGGTAAFLLWPGREGVAVVVNDAIVGADAALPSEVRAPGGPSTVRPGLQAPGQGQVPPGAGQQVPGTAKSQSPSFAAQPGQQPVPPTPSVVPAQPASAPVTSVPSAAPSGQPSTTRTTVSQSVKAGGTGAYPSASSVPAVAATPGAGQASAPTAPSPGTASPPAAAGSPSKTAVGINSAPITDADLEMLGNVGPTPATTKKKTSATDDDDEPEVETPEMKKTMDGAGSAFDQLNF